MKIIRGIILTAIITLWSCSSDQPSVATEDLATERTTHLNKLLRYSVVLMDSSDFQRASTLLDSLKSVAISENDNVLLSGVLNNQGNLSYRLGDFDKSIPLIEASLTLDKELGDSSAMGAKLKNIGISYKEQGKFQIAIRNYRESLNIVKALNDSNEIASLNNSIGNLYNDLDNHEESLHHYSQALATWTALKLNGKIVLALGNKGNALLGLGRIEEAIEVYKQTLDLKRPLGQKYSIAITLNNLGEAFIKNGRYSEAEEHLLESLRLREEVGRRDGIAIVANNLADLETKRGRFRIAQEWLNRAKLIIDETGAADKKLENLKLQRELFAKVGQYEKAFRVDILYDEMNQTAFKEQVVEVNKLQYDYDLEQEEQAKELAESQLKVSEAERQSEQIRNRVQSYIIIATLLLVTVVSYFALKLRKKNNHIENLMRELHHRVKNHLGMISGMFGAQSEQGTVSSADLLEEAKTRVEAVNGIHRRLYRQDEYEFVNMEEYFTELVDNSALVFGLYRSIQKELNIDSEPLEIDKAISVGLIANEVLTNSFKYGLQNTEKPLLKIVLEKAAKGYRMVIFNNAAPDQKPITESTGFGKELIKRLTANLKGESKTTQQNGFQFELTFP